MNDVENKPNSLSLEEINGLTGRQFSSLEEFKKQYQNLSSFVGKKTEAKEVIVEKILDESLKQELESTKAKLSQYEELYGEEIEPSSIGTPPTDSNKVEEKAKEVLNKDTMTSKIQLVEAVLSKNKNNERTYQ